MDQKSSTAKVPFSQKWAQIRQLVGSRMMIGIYLGQYCINALTYFFITVPGVPGAGTRHVDSESGVCCLGPGHLWLRGGVLGGSFPTG